MPKCLTPVPREKVRGLHIEVASLQAKLAEQSQQYQNELDSLRAQLATKDAEIERMKNPSGKGLKETSKSYLLPTKATQRKQIPKKKPSNPSPPTVIRDPQGKLVVDSSLNEAGFTQPTKSTLSREGKLLHPNTGNDSSSNDCDTEWSQFSTEPTPGPWDTSEGFERETTALPQNHPLESYHPSEGDRGDYRESCHCQFCEDSRSGRRVQVVEEIQERTQSHDDFFQQPSSHVYIPFTHQLRLLRGAYSIAQHAYYHGLEKYWPGKEMDYYPLGPESVRFGTGEMKKLFGDMIGFSVGLRDLLYPELRLRYPLWSDLCTHMPTFIKPTISSMVGIRNALAHPSNQPSEVVDALLKNVHDLTCMMRDEARALEVRALRDELRELVQESFTELVRLEPLLPLPTDILWPVHHEATCQEAVRFLGFAEGHPWSRMDRAKENYYDPAIVRAARHWAEQHTIVGFACWNYKKHYLSYKHQEHLINRMKAQKRLQQKQAREGRLRPRVELEIDLQKICERPLLM